jgi:hypothetical protein
LKKKEGALFECDYVAKAANTLHYAWVGALLVRKDNGIIHAYAITQITQRDKKQPLTVIRAYIC